MQEGDRLGVEHRAGHLELGAHTAVAGVAEDGMPDGSKVHAYLVRAPGLELAPHDRGEQRITERAIDLVAGACLAALNRDGHARAVT